MRYEVTLPEEKKERKWKIFVIFFLSLALHAGALFLFRGQIAAALQEARLREIELLEEKLAKKKKLNPKAAKKLEKEKKKVQAEKKGDNKPPGKMSLAPKLSTTIPNPNIKIGGPKLPDVKIPENLKIQIAQSQILPEQIQVENIDLSQLQNLQEMQAAIDLESVELSDVGVADVVIAISGGGASTSEILAQEAVPAISLGGPGIEGALGGGLGFGEGWGIGGGIGGEGGISLEEGGLAAPSTEIEVGAAASEAIKAVQEALQSAAAPSAGKMMELTGQVANRKILKKVKPIYPARARREGWEGVVVLKFWVTPEGAVVNITVVRSSGYPELDRAAMSALRQWRFAPKQGAGNEWGQLTVRFRLT